VERIPVRRAAVLVLCVFALLVTSLPAGAYSDGDSDKVEDEDDNCRGSANPLQFDIDEDGEGDLCERPIPMSDAFAGTPGVDLVFGSFLASVLTGGDGADALYGGQGDDVLDGGPGRDAVIGGPGNDRMTGGPGCDVFGIHTAIEHRDVITDFDPTIDRLRFPPRAREAVRNRLPLVDSGGSEHLEISFIIEEAPDAVVVFEGIKPGTRLVLSTKPCEEPPPPPSICPQPLARQTMLFVGFDDLFCPDRGELGADIGVYSSARFGLAAHKTLGSKILG
jgi:hypothetical protein